MEKETLVQVRNYLIERRVDALQYSDVETKEIDPVMLDLARIVVEDKIRDLEPKQGVEAFYNGKEGHISIVNGVIKANKEICLGLCELSIPKQFSEELEKIEKMKQDIFTKDKDMTLRERDVIDKLIEMINCNEQILYLINRYNKGLNMIKELVDSKTEDALHQS